ncbi:MAG: hypothetical protein KJ739_06265 [Nitrospinae bacterium]|nr:hypothetical protein [Nitrospinota bacterium]
MDSSDFSNRREEDKDIRAFREDYPDVYDFVLKVLDGNCDKPTLQAFKDEHGEDCLKAFLKIISGKASRDDIHVFLEAYPQGHEEIYNALVKMIQNRKPRREDLPESVPSREKFTKGDFIGQKYEVFGVLGEGACGIVYKGENKMGCVPNILNRVYSASAGFFCYAIISYLCQQSSPPKNL